MPGCRCLLLGLCLGLIAGCGSSSSSSSAGPTTVPAGSTGTATQGGSLATWILVGGTAKPAYQDVFLDPELNPGELFIIPQSPLAGGTTYTLSVALTAGGETFTHTWTFTTGGMTTSSTDPVTTLNDLRQECGQPALTVHPALSTSSTKHAGYQALEGASITHFEPDTGNKLYVANEFYDRIQIAADGTANGPWLAPEESEDIASNGGVNAVLLLWNTVYHRLPMMRSDTELVGFGDSSTAQAAYPADNVPLYSAQNWQYATLDFGGSGVSATTVSYWPKDGASDVATLFYNQSEEPQPIGSGTSTPNPNGTTGNPDTVGPPLHVILPSAANFSSISVSLTP